ncbi:alkene reductase [Psychromicrobium sp. YIM B11713]|uniref:alkene reductase n=1 Tax=Psychromicrobium sp. YIM B11713 TaxID=3145233 RepID=UPI00374F4632
MNIFTPVTLGALTLPNRVVMAPLTRLRNGEDGVPAEILAEHYAQRAGLGLIVTEGTYPSHESRSYIGQPGIVTEAQAAGWAKVAEAVHRAGGRIFMQIMNGGRTGHSKMSGVDRTIAPSAIAISGEVRVGAEKLPPQVPHALTIEEVGVVRDEFVAAARRAIDAGFDGVEIHGANGYLVHQFLSPVSNVREDRYGGSPQARASFAVEVLRAVAAEIGAERVGIRLSPEHNIQDVLETNPEDVKATYHALLEGVSDLELAYLSVLHRDPASELVQGLRSSFGGAFMFNSGFSTLTSREEAAGVLSDELADLIAVGRPVIANPDLIERWEAGHPENEPNPATFYGGGAEGYNDYPRLSA